MSTEYDLGGGGNAFTFETVGDVVTGKITNIQEQQQTDMDSGQPAVWDNGTPKMMVAVELQTNLRDPEDTADDGKRTVYLKGSKKPESESSQAAVLAAVKAATGGTRLTVGGELTLAYVGDGVASRKGFNPPKRYQARYVPGSVNLDPAGHTAAQGNGWGTPGGWNPQNGGNVQPPPQAAQQPVYAPPAQQGYTQQGQQAPPPQQPVQQYPGGPFQDQGQPTTPLPPQQPAQPDPASDPAYAAFLQYQAQQALAAQQSQQGGQG